MYQIVEVDGVDASDTICRFNSMDSHFPALEQKHLNDGYWFLAFNKAEVVAFAGLTPMEPFPNVGYLKRCYVLPDHHGHGLQLQLIIAREQRAKQLGWEQLVSECLETNKYSNANFRKAGFDLCEPEQRWGNKNSLYWTKFL